MTDHGPVVMRVCRALVGPADAEDAWSDTFLSAMQAYPSLSHDSDIRGWLVTIAHRKAIDQLRRSTRRGLTTARLADLPSHDDSLPERDEQLVAALDALAPKQRLAVIYRYLADLAYTEIAGLLECSEAAARRSAADGIARLRTTYSRGTST